MHRALEYLRVIYIITVRTVLAAEEYINSTVFMQEPFDNQAQDERTYFALDNQDDKNDKNEMETIWSQDSNTS